MVSRFYRHIAGCILCTPQDKWYILSYSLYCEIHVFLQENILHENEPQKPKNLKKMLAKSQASDA